MASLQERSRLADTIYLLLKKGISVRRVFSGSSSLKIRNTGQLLRLMLLLDKLKYQTKESNKWSLTTVCLWRKPLKPNSLSLSKLYFSNTAFFAPLTCQCILALILQIKATRSYQAWNLPWWAPRMSTDTSKCPSTHTWREMESTRGGWWSLLGTSMGLGARRAKSTGLLGLNFCKTTILCMTFRRIR